MFVSETSIFNPSAIRIRISSLEGVDTLIEVTPDTSVDRLKIGAVSQIYDQREGYKLSLYYRLLHVASGQVLNEESTVLDAGIKDNGNQKLRLSHYQQVSKDRSSITSHLPETWLF